MNDFRYYLQLAHTTSKDNNNDSNNTNNNTSNNSKISHHRYVASLVAIRLGLRDAIVDAAILYSITYSIVAGLTWNDTDPNIVYIIWGVSAITSAFILAIGGLKIPQWMGYYHKSNLQFLTDTSGRAPSAVRTLKNEGSQITSDFRYKVRLGVGKHLHTFICYLLPFYINLKVWALFISIMVGIAFGLVYLFVLHKCKQRYDVHLGRVAMLASVFLSICSSLIFVWGMDIIDNIWDWNLTDQRWVLGLTTFFGWLAVLVLIQIIQYYEQVKFDKDHVLEEGSEQEIEHLFVEDVNETCVQEGHDQLGLGDAASYTREEPLLEQSQESPKVDESERYIFRARRELAKLKEVANVDGSSIPRQVYDAFATIEQPEMKWYHHLWQVMPFKPLYSFLRLKWAQTCMCCPCKAHTIDDDSGYYTNSFFYRVYYILLKVIAFVINVLAVYVAAVAMGATVQIRNTKAKLPYVQHVLYDGQNEGPVCSFDEKCGTIQGFDNVEDSLDANYTVAHCGECGACSAWNDMELQYSTRDNLAERAQDCAKKSLFGSIEDLQKCLEEDIGWTSDCALCWAEDIVCTKKFCTFIFLQESPC